MLVEKSSWNCASLALRFDWFNADDAVERTANGIEIGYGRGQQREQERGMGNSARGTGTGTGTGTTGRAAEWGEHVPFGVARCQIWLRSVFQQQQQQQQIELIVKEMLEKNLWHDGGGARRSLCSSCCCGAHKFHIQSCFYLLWAPFFAFTVKFCATNLCNANLFFIFVFVFAFLAICFPNFFISFFFLHCNWVFLWNIFFAWIDRFKFAWIGTQ